MNVNQCRICLKVKRNTSDIFKNTKSGMISTKIMSITKLKIYPDDGHPNIICYSCKKRLQNCIQFIKLCEKSDSELKKSLLTNGDVNSIESADSISSNNDEDEECDENLYIATKTVNVQERILIKSENSSDNSENTSIISGNRDLNILDNNEETIKSFSLDLINSNKSDKINQKTQCFTCGKILSSSHRLKCHMASHSEIKPYSCKYCNKKFSLSENLIVHMRTHTGEKPYSCVICKESFTHYSNLIVHKRKHTGQTPYKCVLCPRSFRTLGHWQYHTRVHTGEKKYECDKCSRAFITQGALKQHMDTHTGKRLHVCSICGVRFTRSSNLKRHTLSAHRGKNMSSTESLKKIKRNDLVSRKVIPSRKSRNEIID